MKIKTPATPATPPAMRLKNDVPATHYITVRSVNLPDGSSLDQKSFSITMDCPRPAAEVSDIIKHLIATEQTGGVQ